MPQAFTEVVVAVFGVSMVECRYKATRMSSISALTFLVHWMFINNKKTIYSLIENRTTLFTHN